MKPRTDMRRTASRTMGTVAVVIGMGSGIALLLAPLVSPTGREAPTPSPVHAADSSTPMLLAALALAGIGFALLRWSRRR